MSANNGSIASVYYNEIVELIWSLVRQTLLKKEERNQSMHLPRGLFALFSASEDRLRVFDFPFAIVRRLRPAMMDSRVVFARQSMRLVYQNFRVLFQHESANFD